MSQATKFSRRGFLSAAALTGGAATLAACGSSGGSSDTLTVMNWDPPTGTPWNDAFDKFTKKTGKKIKIQYTPDMTNYWAKTRALLGSPNPPDLMRIDDDNIPQYADTGKLADLSSYLKKAGLKKGDFFPSVYDIGRQSDGSIPAWSLGIQPRVIFYNKTAFQHANVPLPPTTWTDKDWTWDDFLDRAKKLTDGDKMWGAAVLQDTGYEVVYPVNNGGTGMFSADGKQFTLSNAPDAAAVQWVADLTCKAHVQPSWSELKQSERPNQMFVGGQIAMYEATSSFVSYAQENVKDFEWDIAPIPGNRRQRTYGSQITWCIPKSAANRDAAWQLLSFMTKPEGAQIFASTNFFVPGLTKSAALIKPGAKSPKHVGIIVDGAQRCELAGRVLGSERAKDIYRPPLDAVYNCGSQAQPVLNGVKSKAQAAMSNPG